MTREIDDTPNTPGTVGYDPSKPATVSGSRPGVPVGALTAEGRDAARSNQEYAAKHYVGAEREIREQMAEGAPPRPWASGHCAYDILNNATDLRLSLTVEGQNFSGLVQRPGGAKEIAAMLRALAEQVESGRA